MPDDVVEIQLRKVLLDILLFNLVGWPNFLLGKYGTPFQRGVFCDDDTIKYPLREGTVTFGWLVVVGFGVNAIGMFITEYLKKNENPKRIICNGVKIPWLMYRFYCAFGMFSFGDLILWGICDSIKFVIGRLRPHFYHACLPEICFTRFNIHEYYEDFKCKNKEPKELRLSFPSGHTSFYIYTMVYFAIYLHKRMTWTGSDVLKHVLQYLAVGSAVIVAMTRVSDYKHHWSDVLAGMFLGSLVAVIISVHFSDLFTSDKKSREGKHSSREEKNQARPIKNDCADY